jgi:DNA-binding response OmpR family regulator
VTISGMPFIAKPFTPDALVERVRMILDAPSPFARPAPPTPPDPAPGA